MNLLSFIYDLDEISEILNVKHRAISNNEQLELISEYCLAKIEVKRSIEQIIYEVNRFNEIEQFLFDQGILQLKDEKLVIE